MGSSHPPFALFYPSCPSVCLFSSLIGKAPKLIMAAMEMTPCSSSDVSRTPSTSSGSTEITQAQSSDENITNIPLDPAKAFQRWRPSYHIQAPSGWMNVSIEHVFHVLFGQTWTTEDAKVNVDANSSCY